MVSVGVQRLPPNPDKICPLDINSRVRASSRCIILVVIFSFSFISHSYSRVNLSLSLSHKVACVRSPVRSCMDTQLKKLNLKTSSQVQNCSPWETIAFLNSFSHTSRSSCYVQIHHRSPTGSSPYFGSEHFVI